MNLGKDSESLCVEFTEGNPEMHVRVKRTGLGLPSRKPTQVPTETDLGLLPGPARPWEVGGRWWRWRVPWKLRVAPELPERD